MKKIAIILIIQLLLATLMLNTVSARYRCYQLPYKKYYHRYYPQGRCGVDCMSLCMSYQRLKPEYKYYWDPVTNRTYLGATTVEVLRNY